MSRQLILELNNFKFEIYIEKIYEIGDEFELSITFSDPIHCNAPLVSPLQL